MAWFKKERKPRTSERVKLEIPADAWEKCDECGHIDIKDRFVRALNVCPNCGHHRRISAQEYIDLLVDEGSWHELDGRLRSTDPLHFEHYQQRLETAIQKAGPLEAVRTGYGRLDGMPLDVAVMDFNFMGGSMGSVVGEKIARLTRRSAERHVPLVIVSASGGARMQEGVLSLMQMAKSSVEIARLRSARVPFISVLTNPTTEGLLDVLGHPERHFPSIHIAGTNGKGSTCAFTAAELRARGLKVGVYTSPHLVSVRERVEVDGVPIGEEAFAEWTAFLRPHIERLDASFFEATTAIAFADLAARGVDIAVIEVGLGGRLDSTNVITPLVSVVTKIAREHTDYLGNDLASIAREKAGIAKRDVPFVTGELDPAVRQVLVTEAERRGAQPLIPVDARGAPTRPLGLKGRHQHANAWVALGALNALAPPFGPVGDEWPDSFAHAYVPARFDVRGRWIFDVAHNPDGARVLADTLREYDPPHPRRALVGVLGDKDYLGMIDCLTPEVDSFVFTMPDTAPERRRWDLGRLERELGHLAVAHELEPQFERASERVRDDAATAIVTGSLHTLGDALARLPGS